MPKRKDNSQDEDSPILTKADFDSMVPFNELPPRIQRTLTGVARGAQKAPLKVPVSIRLSQDVANDLRATGAGWQTRADEALRAWLKQNKIAS